MATTEKREREQFVGTARYAGSPFGKYFAGRGGPTLDDIKAMQARGYSGDRQYWVRYPKNALSNYGYYYDTDAEKAAYTRVKLGIETEEDRKHLSLRKALQRLR